MCGRFTLTTPVEQLAEQFDAVVEIGGAASAPRYNVAPTQSVVGLLKPEEAGPRVLRAFHWGLIPFWAKEPGIGSRMINARAETLAEKPAFRNALAKRPCLVLADGFYEWQRTDGGKQPLYIYRADGRPIAFAGLWERWAPRDSDQQIDSCTIVTTRPNDLMAPVHDRMPAILTDEMIDFWLNTEIPPADRLAVVLNPIPSELLTMHPVSTRVNSPRFDDAACIAPL